MKHIGLWLCLTLLIGIAPGLHAQTDDCSPGLAPRLVVGEWARVTPGDANNVRAEPLTSADLVGQIPGEGVFAVLDGPACSGGLTWWQVRYADITGWTVEGSGDYWLEPLNLAVYEDDVIRFGYDADTMGDITVEILEEDLNENMQGGPVPERIRYTFNEWPVGERSQFFANAQITILRTDDLRENMFRFTRSQQALRVMLEAGIREDTMEIPYPTSGAVQLGVAAPQIMRFVNGEGVVFATAYAQDFFDFVPNRYDFIGVTDDGAYIMYLTFDVETAPSNVPFNRQDFIGMDDAIFARYEAYVAEVAADLATRPDNAYEPDLSLLRRMIASIEIVGDWGS